MQKKLHTYLLLALAFWLLPFSAYTQTYPVTISTQLTQPSPIYLSNYANTASINSPIKVQLMLNDLTIMNRQVRLKCYFQGAVSFVSNDFVVGASPIYLEGGMPTLLTNVELGPYFEFQNLQGINPNQYAQPLPEGVYTISFEVYDFATNKKLSKKSSVTTVIFQNEPPFLNLPANKAGIVEQNIQNIIFNWTPRSINVSNVEYEFSLVEIWNTNTPIQNAFAYSTPLFTTTTRNTTVQYSIAEPQLIPGRTYAWRVKAKALIGAEEIGVFKNNGYSEIFSFKYLTLCNPPKAVKTTDVSQDQAKISWSGEVDNYDYQVNYREKNADSKWYPLVTPREYVTISNLKPKTAYEYTVGAACDPNEYTLSNIQEFTTMAQDEIAFIGCGIKPDPVALSNKTPLPNLFPNDVVTAGDFPIVVLKSTGSNGNFTGEGYVTLPFLAKFRELIDAAAALAGNDENGDSKVNIGKYTRIRITFDNIGVNTDFKLISGEIIASYDPNWGSMIDGDKLVEDVSNFIDDFVELNFFSSNDDIPENASTPTDNNSVDKNDKTQTPTPTPTSSSPVQTSPIVTSPPIVDNSTQNTTASPNTTVPPNETTLTSTPAPVIVPPKLDFKSVSLKAFDNETKKRIANEKQTLYYVTNKVKKDPKTDFVLTIDRKLAKDKIKDNVHWFRDEIAIDKSEGLLKLTSRDLNKDATIKSISGFPTESTRIVNIKFVPEDRQKIDIVKKMSPLLSVFNEINYWTKEFKTFGIPCSVSILDDVKKAINKNQLSVSYHKYNEEIETNRLYNKVEEFEFGATGMEIFKLSCGKEITVKIPLTSYELDLASANIEVTAGIKGTINIRKEETIETNKISYEKSKVSGGGYISPNVNASLLGVKGIAELEAGLKFEYPYKGSKTAVGFILYSDDFVGKVLVSKDASIFVSNDFIYEIFRLPTAGSIEVGKIDINELLK
jgi:hypothetical protein